MSPRKKASETTQQIDPRKAHPQPPFPHQRQEPPGLDQKLNPRADHGEESYHGHGRLLGRTALITGGDSGIGRAVAIAFAREGADVAISYLPQEAPDAEETRHWVEEAGQQAITLPGDIQDEHHCRAMIDQVLEQTGRLDILVNNAAFQMTHEKLEDFTSEEIERTFRTNIFAMFYLVKAAAPHMKPGSAIINTSSIQAFNPTAMLLPYSTTKGAIVTFTKGLAKLLIKQGIRVNSVAPGPVWTPLIPSSMPDEKTENFGENTPLERAAQPAEIAPLFVFLASDESSYVTGEVYGATGGKMPT